LRDLTDDFVAWSSYGPVVRDRDVAAEVGDPDDEGLISRFWKAPAPLRPVTEPVPPPEREAEPD